MGRLRERNERLKNDAIQARRRLAQRERSGSRYSAKAIERDTARADRHPAPSMVALLFAQPDSAAIRSLDARGEYFDHRTGNVWGLFFPGYYRSAQTDYFEAQTGARAVGRGYGRTWYFHAREFNSMRQDVELRSSRAWG